MKLENRRLQKRSLQLAAITQYSQLSTNVNHRTLEKNVSYQLLSRAKRNASASHQPFYHDYATRQPLNNQVSSGPT